VCITQFDPCYELPSQRRLRHWYNRGHAKRGCRGRARSERNDNSRDACSQSRLVLHDGRALSELLEPGEFSVAPLKVRLTFSSADCTPISTVAACAPFCL
jgi:hypothetical protein